MADGWDLAAEQLDVTTASRTDQKGDEMSEEQALTTSRVTAAEMVQTDGPLVACDPAEMATAQKGLLEWARQMREKIAAETEELRQAHEIAARNRWGSRSVLVNQIKRAERRMEFYAKIGSAVEAGYLIVPNFDMDVFAIRTKARVPRGGWATHRQQDQVAGFLPEGEGENVSPHAVYEHDTQLVKNYKGEEVRQDIWRPESFEDVDFPMEVARPVIMERTAEALRLKLFDEMGIARDSKLIRRGDPMILGRLRNPRSTRPDATFFIAWMFDRDNV